MTVFDLFDSIGNVDDELIEMAKQPKKSHRKLIAGVGSLAACLVIACTGLIILQNVQKNNGLQIDVSGEQYTGSASPENSENPRNSENPGNSENPRSLENPRSSENPETSKNSESPESSVHENDGEVIPEKINADIYYVSNGKIESQTVNTSAIPETVFEFWKSKNNIGDEVKLLSVQFIDNGTTEISEYNGAEVVTHTIGDKTTYTLTVTKNLERYYDSIDKDLLLEALEKTMTGMYNPKPDEYKLIISDSVENEESESNRIVPDDNRYNVRGEVLE